MPTWLDETMGGRRHIIDMSVLRALMIEAAAFIKKIQVTIRRGGDFREDAHFGHFVAGPGAEACIEVETP